MKGQALGLVLLLLGSAASAEPNLAVTVRAKLARARQSLTRLPDAERVVLAPRLEEAERAFAAYLALARKQGEQETNRGTLAATGGVLVADDVTGVGAADDLLLPFLALAILVNEVTGAPSQHELEASWMAVVASLTAVAQTAEAVRVRRTREGCSCSCYKQGGGPIGIGQQPNPTACHLTCLRRYGSSAGSQCGSREVTWPQ